MLPPGRAGAIINLALALNGQTAVNLNHTVGDDGLQAMLTQAQVKTVVTSSLYHSKIGKPRLAADSDVTVIYVEDLLKKATMWQRLRALCAVRVLPLRWLCQAQPDDNACILFSSGSTNTPKAIPLTHRQLLANIDGVLDHLQVRDSQEVLLSPLPLFHSFGLTAGTWLPLVSGIHAANHADPRDGTTVGKLAAQTKATFVIATPTFVRGWMRRITPEQFAHAICRGWR